MKARCEVCSNEYDKAFQVVSGGETHLFDCFECAIHALAPVCARCGVKILGHGVERDSDFFCGAHCARLAGVAAAQDRI